MALSIERTRSRTGIADDSAKHRGDAQQHVPGAATSTVANDFEERWEGVKGAGRDLVRLVRENPGKTAVLAAGVVGAAVMSPVAATVLTGVGVAMTAYSVAKVAAHEIQAWDAGRRGDTSSRSVHLRESGRNLFGVGVGVGGFALGRAANAISSARLAQVVRSAEGAPDNPGSGLVSAAVAPARAIPAANHGTPVAAVPPGTTSSVSASATSSAPAAPATTSAGGSQSVLATTAPLPVPPPPAPVFIATSPVAPMPASALPGSPSFVGPPGPIPTVSAAKAQAAQAATNAAPAGTSDTFLPAVSSVPSAAKTARSADADAPIRNLGSFRDGVRERVLELRAENRIPTGLFGFERELQDAARAFPTSGAADFPTYLEQRLRTAVAIEAKYWDGIRTARSPGFDGPRAEQPLMVRFAQQTELHRRNVDVGLTRLSGEGRGFATPHDVHEVRPLDEIAELASRPDAPQWLRGIVERARADGVTTYDVGKADPYVMAGLSQNGRADAWSIQLHRLSPHHADTPMSLEGAFDYVNALRMPRFYGEGKVRPFTDIWQIARADATSGRNGMRLDDLPRIQDAMRAHNALEHEGLITTYYKRLGPERLPDFMGGDIP